MLMPETNPNSDEQLRTRIIQALMLDERTAALNLRVGVLNEIVHLAGQAPSLNIWNLTERIVLGVAGVRGVVNRIEAPDAPLPARTIHLDLPT
jgi:osmotically-inducible protein OsmY